MALDVKKQTMETEAVVSTQTAQTIIQAEAMVSGAGRDAVEVLMEDATVNISGMEVQAGRLLVDGTVIAQLGVPNMELPIQYALTYPERTESLCGTLDFTQLTNGLHFYAPELERLPCLALAMRCARTGGTAPSVMNAANEVAVGLFLNHQIGYNEIYDSVAAAVGTIPATAAPDLDTIRAADAAARDFVRSYFHV